MKQFLAVLNTIFKVIKDRSLEFDVPNVRVHDLRQTFAIWLFAQGKDINIVKKAMGHALVTTQRFDMCEEEEVAKQLNNLRL